MDRPCLPLCFRIRARQSAEASQHRRFVQGDVIGLVALDFILRLVRGGMVYVTFVVDVTSVHFDDFPAHPSGFRIPTHVIAYLERLDHLRLFSQLSATPTWPRNTNSPPFHPLKSRRSTAMRDNKRPFGIIAAEPSWWRIKRLKNSISTRSAFA